MNSRTREKEPLVQLENGVQIRNPWIPLTPGKPILSGSNETPIENQIGMRNLGEFLEISDQRSKQMLNYNRGGNNFNFSALLNQSSGNSYNMNQPSGSYNNMGNSQRMVNGSSSGLYSLQTQTFCNNIPSWGNSPIPTPSRRSSGNIVLQSMCPNTNMSPTMIPRTDSLMSTPLVNLNMQPLSTNMNSANAAPALLNAYSEVDSSWTEGNFTNLLLGNEISDLGSNNKWINSNSTQQMMLSDGFHHPLVRNYNLNSPPRCDSYAISSNANSFPLAPITPDHGNLYVKNRHAEMLKFLVDEGSYQGQDKMENLVSSIGNEAIENQCNELLQTIVDSSSVVVPTPPEENKISEKSVDQGVIDLNETPKQKAPKRRKHRPRVVIEGKPKRTPKQRTPKNTEKEETPRKRRYVRKKKDPEIESTTPQQPDSITTKAVPNFESQEKSCRKRLSFEIEKGEFHDEAGEAEVQNHQDNQSMINFNLNYPVNEMTGESLAGAESHDTTAPSATVKYNTLNVMARDLSTRNHENQDNLHSHGELNKNISQANLNLKRSREMRWKSTHQMVERDVGNFIGFCGSKKDYSTSREQAGPSSEHKLDSQSLFQRTMKSENQGTMSPRLEISREGIHKKQKMENGFQTLLSTSQKESITNSTNSTNSRLPNSDGTWVFQSQAQRKTTSLNNGINNSQGESRIPAESYKQQRLTPSNNHMVPERMREIMSTISNQVNNNARLALMNHPNLQSAITSKKASVSGYQQGPPNSHASMQKNRVNIAPDACTAVSFCRNNVTLQERNDNSPRYRQHSIKAREKKKKYSKNTIEEIIYGLQSLNIRDESEETDGKENFALVPYEGGGSMVLYEPKKRKPRPKVDLDPETTRIWNLLMGKEGSEASGAENKDKEKWWDEERNVFRGRAKSFIARMHLVQGDRTFSQWKGSVVDSVIGVFLTQNVSDHLSSSAFMALAAEFPPSSTTLDQTSEQSGTSILTEEPEIQGLAPNGTIRSIEKIMRQPFISEPSDLYLQSSGTERTRLAIEPDGISDENASSSQNSCDSFVLQINGEIQSSSGCNSEAEDSSHVEKSIKINTPTGVQHTNRTATFQAFQNPENERLCFGGSYKQFYNHSAEREYNEQAPGQEKFNCIKSFSNLNHSIDSNISNVQNPILPESYLQLLMAPQIVGPGADCFEVSREECISSFPTRASEMTRGNVIGYRDNRAGYAAEMRITALLQQNELPKNGMSTSDPFAFITNKLTAQTSRSEQGPQVGKHPLSANTHQVKRSGIFESENSVLEKPKEPLEAVRKSGNNQVPDVAKHMGQIIDINKETKEANKQAFLDQRLTDGNAKSQALFSSDPTTGTSAKTSNSSKKQEKEKAEAFDWDSLRKLVQLNGRKSERSLDSLDSMDYEAMRCADVNKISNSIKIRGMNNMLAERIKDFLNRIATDHGSIDLEWLRDVPPDKAKDYLLSIRGLGLKSVECVRLLTLHHLAFPVDTNVGRIAVRLGWVPLQPLPESLQLHLLEMYPVLESVQKYLWPRLCKLDQPTLYELHYQLITFGKVFCTKSKPNCNACPMRGECRHFASAFASARLALPAPEEKSIVGSTMPISADRRDTMAIKPMLLLQTSDGNGEPRLVLDRCEPIIEEPATPEPEATEIRETDIEDFFYEDPDEIPTIKLNVEQLAANLRNFMEEHTDLQEGDMSKAIVALTPEVASIPVPKLKYILRLRTERQVYVLPETHPLVKDLDMREADDPSPYLLALLAPGETASSGQTPEKRHESNTCNPNESSVPDDEANSVTVRGTLLIPCRTAMRGSFPLNGTYFQVNEVFADHESSVNPLDVPRAWLWHLETRTVYFGTSATSIFRGMTTKEIQNSFWRGFVCVRGFDRKSRAPRPLNRNLHIPQSKTIKPSNAAE